jgi:outer membrane protein TolC
MKLVSILLILPAAALTLLGQTNAPESVPAVTNNASTPAGTNAWEYALPTPKAGSNLPAIETPPVTVAPNARQLSLQDCIQLTLQHNLDLQITRYNPQIALFNVRESYGAYDPILGFSAQHDHNESVPRILSTNLTIPSLRSDDNTFNPSLTGYSPIGTTYGLQGNATDTYGGSPELSTGTASFNVTQPLLKNFWIDSSRLQIRVAKNRLKFSEYGLKWEVLQIVTQMELAYFDLIYSRENVVVLQNAVELAARLVAENRKRLEVGALAPLDLESAEAQAAQSRAAVLAAQSQLGTQERVVKALITDNFVQWADLVLVPSGKLTDMHYLFNRQESWSKGLSQRPDLLQSKLEVERQGIILKYNRNQLFPELDVFGTYGYNGAGREFDDALYNVQQLNHRSYTYGARISIPLANTTARNAYKAQKATVEQTILQLKQAEQIIMISIDNDIGTIQANYEQVLATRAARQYAESALNAEQTKLQNGKSTVYTVLQMQRDLTTARGNEILALASYNKSYSLLSRDEGTTLERLGIDWQVK